MSHHILHSPKPWRRAVRKFDFCEPARTWRNFPAFSLFRLLAWSAITQFLSPFDFFPKAASMPRAVTWPLNGEVPYNGGSCTARPLLYIAVCCSSIDNGGDDCLTRAAGVVLVWANNVYRMKFGIFFLCFGSSLGTRGHECERVKKTQKLHSTQPFFFFFSFCSI